MLDVRASVAFSALEREFSSHTSGGKRKRRHSSFYFSCNTVSLSLKICERNKDEINK